MKYIGLIYWNNDPDDLLDRTSVSTSLRQVWRECCKANRLHAGEIHIYEYFGGLDTVYVGNLIYSFSSVEECIDKFNKKFILAGIDIDT